jgi:hypothetical protein
MKGGWEEDSGPITPITTITQHAVFSLPRKMRVLLTAAMAATAVAVQINANACLGSLLIPNPSCTSGATV